jgi:Immunoglobulin domain
MLLNQKLELGSNATVRCRADGQMTPRIRWSKVGQVDLPEHVRDFDGALHFTKVHSSDAGEYVCVASSDQGVINITFRIDVVGTMPQNTCHI